MLAMQFSMLELPWLLQYEWSVTLKWQWGTESEALFKFE